MENILIWGTGKRARDAYRHLRWYTKQYKVVAFGDNAKEKVGQIFCGKSVIGAGELSEYHSLDCIVIASSAQKEIKLQLMEIVRIPIYESIDSLIFTRATVDISGFCNAKCKWCVTGQRNCRQKVIDLKKYMSFELFDKIYANLTEKQIISPETELMLYSWGEPLLNPDYLKIINFLAKKGQKYSVSTNASKAVCAKRKNVFQNCVNYTISMPGFSQQSYDKIHELRFESVKENIKCLVKDLRYGGFHGDASISYHVYKFNMDEIKEAVKFAEELGIRVMAYYPYFNGISMACRYLEGNMNQEELKQIDAEMELSHVEGLLAARPEEYHCFLENILSIDYQGNLTLCCASDDECDDYLWESVDTINSLQDMWRTRSKQLVSATCQRCRNNHIDYWIGNNPLYTL